MSNRVRRAAHTLSPVLRRSGQRLMQPLSLSILEWALLLLSILPFVLISAYNHPTDDDFLDAVQARHLRLWETVGFYYMRWTGRYTSSFFYALGYAPSTLDSWLLVLRVAPVIMLMALLSAGRFVIGVFSTHLSNAAKWRFAGYSLIFYLCGIPLMSSAIYWYNGAVVYTLGILLGVCLIGVIGKFEQATRSGEQRAWAITAACLAGLLMGTNEIVMLVGLTGLFGWVCFSAGSARAWQPWPVAIAALALAGAVVALLAPGNFIRVATIHESTPFFEHLLVAVSKTAYLTTVHLVRWATNGLLLLATGLFLIASHRQPRPSQRRALLYVGLAGFVLTYLAALPIVWLTKDVPSRVWNTIYCVFLISWFVLAYLAASWQGLKALRRRTAPYYRPLRILWLVLILLRQDTKVHQAYIDLVFKARAYDAAQHHRYRLLQQARQQGRREVVVPPLFIDEYRYPATIFLHELELSPSDISNEGMGSYFGVDSVYVSSLPHRVRRHFWEL